MKLKRKYGSRYDWKRVKKKGYRELFIETKLFRGYVSLLHLVEVRYPLCMSYKDRAICIADDGYFWMQHFPDQQHYSVTTVFDTSGSIVQWYIDICKEIGYCTKNGPWMDDLYLDLIVLPTGEIIEKDREELETALENNDITIHEYNLAWAEFEGLKELLIEGDLRLREMTMSHFELLTQSNNARGKGGLECLFD